ncbi:MAG TPA: hypothetical protein VNX26_05290 [Candidatus Acidoferrum sp.]|jgi:uncharacterized protein (UPF0332 family)|nr:hypothetical protein [Candidatus Acidoferrum sp.]
MRDVVDSRLELAKALRELADGSSEAALRNALSRSYYSIFHAANVLFGKVSHGDIAKRLGSVDLELEAQVEKLQQLRSQADYDPNFVEREFKGNLEQFRLDVRRQVDEGLSVFNRILREIERNVRG